MKKQSIVRQKTTNFADKIRDNKASNMKEGGMDGTMAEFCFACLKKLEELQAKEHEFILSKEEELCENCMEYKQVVIKRKVNYQKEESD